jgi:phosphosulfolactate phosphohydrolase-like enzyme
MSNKMKFEFAAIILATALLATVSITPLNYSAAQNAAMPQTEDTITAGMIASKIDQFKSEHPAFAAVLDKVQSMDAAQTLKAIIGTHALERMLDAHAKISILQNATGVMQNATGVMQNATGVMQNATGVMQNTTSTP